MSGYSRGHGLPPGCREEVGKGFARGVEGEVPSQQPRREDALRVGGGEVRDTEAGNGESGSVREPEEPAMFGSQRAITRVPSHEVKAYLIDWDNGWPCGVYCGRNAQEALDRAEEEIVTVGWPRERGGMGIRVVAWLALGAPVPIAYWPSVTRWARPKKV